MNSSITGWKDVYSFTLSQVLKSKAYLVSYFILVLLTLLNLFLGISQKVFSFIGVCLHATNK